MRAAIDHVVASFRHEPAMPDATPDGMSGAMRDDAAPNQAAQLASQLLENYRDHLAGRGAETVHTPSC